MEGTGNGSVLTARSTLHAPAITSDPVIVDYDYENDIAHVELRFTLPSAAATHTQLVLWRVPAGGQMEPTPCVSRLIAAPIGVALFDVDLKFIGDDGVYAVMLRPAVVQVIAGTETVVEAEGAMHGTIHRSGVGVGGTEVGGVTPQPILPPAPPSPPPTTEP